MFSYVLNAIEPRGTSWLASAGWRPTCNRKRVSHHQRRAIRVRSRRPVKITDENALLFRAITRPIAGELMRAPHV